MNEWPWLLLGGVLGWWANTARWAWRDARALRRWDDPARTPPRAPMTGADYAASHHLPTVTPGATVPLPPISFDEHWLPPFYRKHSVAIDADGVRVLGDKEREL